MPESKAICQLNTFIRYKMKEGLLITGIIGITILSANARNSTDARLDSLEKAWEKTLNEVVVTGTRTPKLLKDSLF